MLRELQAHDAVLPVLLILLPEEHHEVRVSFEGTGFAKVGQHRLGASGLDLPRQLRERDHRDLELAGDRLQGAGDLRDLLHAVVLVAFGALNELQVVDDDHVELPALGLEPP